MLGCKRFWVALWRARSLQGTGRCVARGLCNKQFLQIAKEVKTTHGRTDMTGRDLL